MFRQLGLALIALIVLGCAEKQLLENHVPTYKPGMLQRCPTGMVELIRPTYNFFLSDRLVEFDYELTTGCYAINDQLKTSMPDGSVRLEKRSQSLEGPGVTYLAKSKRLLWQRRLDDGKYMEIYYARPLTNHHFARTVQFCDGMWANNPKGEQVYFMYPCGADRDYNERLYRFEKAYLLNRLPVSQD